MNIVNSTPFGDYELLGLRHIARITGRINVFDRPFIVLVGVAEDFEQRKLHVIVYSAVMTIELQVRNLLALQKRW